MTAEPDLAGTDPPAGRGEWARASRSRPAGLRRVNDPDENTGRGRLVRIRKDLEGVIADEVRAEMERVQEAKKTGEISNRRCLLMLGALSDMSRTTRSNQCERGRQQYARYCKELGWDEGAPKTARERRSEGLM